MQLSTFLHLGACGGQRQGLTRIGHRLYTSRHATAWGQRAGTHWPISQGRRVDGFKRTLKYTTHPSQISSARACAAVWDVLLLLTEKDSRQWLCNSPSNAGFGCYSSVSRLSGKRGFVSVSCMSGRSIVKQYFSLYTYLKNMLVTYFLHCISLSAVQGTACARCKENRDAPRPAQCISDLIEPLWNSPAFPLSSPVSRCPVLQRSQQSYSGHKIIH